MTSVVNGFEFHPHVNTIEPDSVSVTETPILTEVLAVVAEKAVVDDQVNHPAHYNQGKAEVIDLIENMGFLRGNIVKYVCRAGHKPGIDELVDLEKAAWYLQREIERVKSSRSV